MAPIIMRDNGKVGKNGKGGGEEGKWKSDKFTYPERMEG